MTKEEILQKVRNLRVDQANGVRKPYKPLLLLLAIAKLQHNERQLPFEEVTKDLKTLFQAFAPSSRTQPEPRKPYWHLQSDGLWNVFKGRYIVGRIGPCPPASELRGTHGQLTDAVWQAFKSDQAMAGQVIKRLLDGFFPESLHQDLEDRIGFTSPDYLIAESAMGQEKGRQQGLAKFREEVLVAYEHRCAVTNFQCLLSGTSMVCEAAHIKWRAYDGPNTVTNGLALEPTLHKLFDLGAWTLTDDRKILVSKKFGGSEEAKQRLRSLHGHPINKPLDGKDLPGLEFIRWHREPGGVFKGPALGL